MRDVACARRAVVRLLIGCAALGLATGAAPAHSPRKPNPPPRYRPMIVLDPGHGGLDPGAIGAGEVYEKRIAFATAVDLARQLTATRHFRVALTRGPDEYVPLRDRVARARAVHADLFLSLHADALPNAAMRGLSVFTLSATASDREAAALADSENREAFAGIRLTRRTREVGEVLMALARRQTDNLSLQLAHDIVAALGRDVRLLENPQRSAGFVVLTAPDIPSVLVELGCLSNPDEERLLQHAPYQQYLAGRLARAVEAYFSSLTMSRDGDRGPRR